MLDKVESETESDNENLLEDSGMGYKAEEQVPDDKVESHLLVKLETTVHVESEFLDIDESPGTKLKNKFLELKWKRASKFVKAKKCTLEANVLLTFQKTPTHCWYLKGLTI